MSSSNKNYLKNLIICYELFISIFLLEIDDVSNSLRIGSNQDLINFENSTKSDDYILEVLRRYQRQTNNNRKTCEIPFNPPNTNYKILGASENTYKPGDFATEFSTLDISCNVGYSLSPFAAKRSLCENGKWSETSQTCLITCPSLKSTETTTVKCRYNNLPLKNCINPVQGTTVVLSCTPLHEEPTIRRNPVRVCKEGRWTPSTSVCYPTCGIKHPKGVPNIINGTDVTIGDYSWQVGIYNSTTKELLCGGSIIDKNIILTAAHCITDYDGNLRPVSRYLVAAGKYYSKYDEARDQFAQYSNILTMHVPGRYSGSVNNFALDIAILILSKPFVITEAVQPVCIEFSEESQYLSENDDGIVTGWGYTQEGGELSEVLKELIIPYIPYNKCFNELPRNFRRFFTEDKICGGYRNNATSICSGDSGGALVFRNMFSDRYFVQGVVSTSPATVALTCDSNQYSLYTYISHHKTFVRDIVALNQDPTPLECTSDGCPNEEARRCLLPDMPKHGKYILVNDTVYVPGTYAPPATEVNLICNDGYVSIPIGTNPSVCADTGNLEPQLGTCERHSAAADVNITELMMPPVPDISKHKNINLLASTSDCGKKRIFNGIKTDLFEYPWMALLTFTNSDGKRSFKCAGTIINDRYILTAAHCIVNSPYHYRLVGVRVGEHNINSDPDCESEGKNISVCADPVQDIEIENRIVHKEFSIGPVINDIGLIRLRTPIQFKRSVWPICLPIINEYKIENFTNTRLIITGWGATNLFDDLNMNFWEVEVSVVQDEVCKSVHGKYPGINSDNKYLCASRPRDTCPDEYGAPLQGTKLFNNDLQYVQYGISLFGGSCEMGIPSVYTRIDYYMDWILDNIKV